MPLKEIWLNLEYTVHVDLYTCMTLYIYYSQIPVMCPVVRGGGAGVARGLWQWCSGSGATGAIAPVPIFQVGAPPQFLFHLFLVNFDYILQKLAYYY